MDALEFKNLIKSREEQMDKNPPKWVINAKNVKEEMSKISVSVALAGYDFFLVPSNLTENLGEAIEGLAFLGIADDALNIGNYELSKDESKSIQDKLIKIANENLQEGVERFYLYTIKEFWV